jgi:hypothetical protein
MKLGLSPELRLTKRRVKLICIFDFEMASNTTTILPQRPQEAARERKREAVHHSGVKNDDVSLPVRHRTSLTGIMALKFANKKRYLGTRRMPKRSWPHQAAAR